MFQLIVAGCGMGLDIKNKYNIKTSSHLMKELPDHTMAVFCLWKGQWKKLKWKIFMQKKKKRKKGQGLYWFSAVHQSVVSRQVSIIYRKLLKYTITVSVGLVLAELKTKLVLKRHGIFHSKSAWPVHPIWKVVLQATVLFVQLEYTLATEEAERIGVDHVARVSSGDATDSSTGDKLTLLCDLASLLTEADTALCVWHFIGRTCQQLNTCFSSTRSTHCFVKSVWLTEHLFQ